MGSRGGVGAQRECQRWGEDGEGTLSDSPTPLVETPGPDTLPSLPPASPSPFPPFQGCSAILSSGNAYRFFFPLARLSCLPTRYPEQGPGTTSFAPIPGCPLGTSRQRNRHVTLPGVEPVPGHPACKQPAAAPGSKGNNMPSSLHLVSRAQGPASGHPKPLGRRAGKGPRGSSPQSLGAAGTHPPSRAAPGSATHLLSQKTCHPPTGQTAILPKPFSLLRLQPPGWACSSHRAPPPSWFLPVLLLTFPQLAGTPLSFFQYCCSLHSFLALIHVSLLQEVHACMLLAA